ncbi:uncharacterized protein LDX57_003651 [Aspergillus melleus]|uniref:uncharacterized protein n=1 Tax=Aspergillus melleus TaxID=138277 RepID=UPI001E8E651D|nr:uncharacterized protein LDX57_003651 [Aspergillus melleus]KAH8425910.1 hypothetical protein LDX57_003651 [Aspergillus melleus]
MCGESESREVRDLRGRNGLCPAMAPARFICVQIGLGFPHGSPSEQKWPKSDLRAVAVSACSVGWGQGGLCTDTDPKNGRALGSLSLRPRPG